MTDRDPILLALSDLIISRIRGYYRLKFDTTNEQSPAVLNCAYLIGGRPSLFVDFLLEQHSFETRGAYCTSSGMHIYATTVDPLAQPCSDAIQRVVDECEHEFARIKLPTSHIRSLRFRFDFFHATSVERDIRKVFFAPLLERFSGTFIYPDITDYDVELESGDWNPHPLGIQTAWEAEYQFHQPVPFEILAAKVHLIFGTQLELGVLTRLPYREIDGVGCRFSLATRFYR